MRIALLTLCRNRLAYTKVCLDALQQNAGVAYDHYVLDNGSGDGTWPWLVAQKQLGRIEECFRLEHNLGVHRGLNFLLEFLADAARYGEDYDVVMNFDNDCELIVPDTIRVTAELAHAHPGWIVGPHVQGLRQPPAVDHEIAVDGLRIGVTGQIGGLCMPLPRGHRYDERAPLYGNGDGPLCQKQTQAGHTVGYLLDYPCNHYLTTDGQWADDPEYFATKISEGLPA